MRVAIDMACVVVAISARAAWAATGHAWGDWGSTPATFALTAVILGRAGYRLLERFRNPSPPDDPNTPPRTA